MKMKLQVEDKDIKNMLDELMEERDYQPAQTIEGRTISIDEFRKKYCGNRGREWVRVFIFDEFAETDYENGGFVLNPRGQGARTIIFEKPAAEWMEKNRRRIDWNGSLIA